MKIDKDAVIKANDKLLSAYIPGITPNDNEDSRKSKAKGLIQVSPNNVDAKSITVRFLTNFVLAVSAKKPDEEIIRKALSAIISPAVGAGKSSAVINGTTVLGDVAQAARGILKVENNSEVLPFIVPVLTSKGCSYNIKSNVKGTSLTTDSDKNDEKANVNSSVKFGARESKVETDKNEGLENTKDVFLMPALNNITSQGNIIDTRAQVTIILKTDGGIISPTISAVNIDFVEIVLEETCNTPPAKPVPKTGGKSQKIGKLGTQKIEGVGKKYAKALAGNAGINTVEALAGLNVNNTGNIDIPDNRLISIIDSAKIALELEAMDFDVDFQNVEIIQKVYGSLTTARDAADNGETLMSKIIDRRIKLPDGFDLQPLLKILA